MTLESEKIIFAKLTSLEEEINLLRSNFITVNTRYTDVVSSLGALTSYSTEAAEAAAAAAESAIESAAATKRATEAAAEAVNMSNQAAAHAKSGRENQAKLLLDGPPASRT